MKLKLQLFNCSFFIQKILQLQILSKKLIKVKSNAKKPFTQSCA